MVDGCEDKVFACEKDIENAISKAASENSNAIFISKKLSVAVSSCSSGCWFLRGTCRIQEKPNYRK